MKKKGKSNDDKKNILYDLMLQSESFFILKELESLASKKGLRSILVKDLLQQLLDDNLVKSEKVGAQNIYWVLKTEESSIIQNQYQKFKEEKQQWIEKIKKESEEYDQIVNDLKYPEDELQKKLIEVKEIKDKINIQSNILEKLKKNDIKEIEKMRNQNIFATESIDRWTNNIYIVKQWVQNRINKPEDIVDRLLGVKDIFDNWN